MAVIAGEAHEGLLAQSIVLIVQAELAIAVLEDDAMVRKVLLRLTCKRRRRG